MSKRKTPLEAFRCEYYRIDKRMMIALPILLLFLGIFTRWVSGSPQRVLYYIKISHIVPPTWLLLLLFSAFDIVSGLALGAALGTVFCSRGEKKYQGAMWFCISLSLGYAWYPIFFCAELFLVSLIISISCLFCSICATICFSRVSNLAFALSLASSLWLLYLLLLNFRIFFSV